jgi:hypothetical protein
MLTSRLLRYGAFFALSAVLFAQATAAASACLRPLSAPAAAGAQQAAHCDAQQKISLNLCLYQFADQSDNNSPQLVAVASAPVVVMLVLPPPLPIALPRENSVAQSPPTDPPIPIRNCCFRI